MEKESFRNFHRKAAKWERLELKLMTFWREWKGFYSILGKWLRLAKAKPKNSKNYVEFNNKKLTFST